MKPGLYTKHIEFVVKLIKIDWKKVSQELITVTVVLWFTEVGTASINFSLCENVFF